MLTPVSFCEDAVLYCNVRIFLPYFFFLTVETNYWWGTINTDANIVPLRQTFLSRYKDKNAKCILLFVSAVLCNRRKVLFNFTIIYKSWKCYDMILTAKICLLIIWIEKLLVFSYSTKPFHHHIDFSCCLRM